MTCCLLLCQSKTDRNNVVLLLIFLFVRNDQLQFFYKIKTMRLLFVLSLSVNDTVLLMMR
jgi:hypothetical protein